MNTEPESIYPQATLDIFVQVTVTYRVKLTSRRPGATPMQRMEEEKVAAEIDECRWVQDTMPPHPDVTMTYVRTVKP